MAKTMCPHCGSPNLDTDTACYDCSKPLSKTKPAAAVAVPPKAVHHQGKLPGDFPGFTALKAAGVNTFAQLRAVKTLIDIPGIGSATASKITEALADADEIEREGEAGEIA